MATEEEQRADNAQRESDLKFLRTTLAHYRLTMTERWELEQLLSDVQSNIVTHYTLTDADWNRLSELRDREPTREVKKDALEKTMEALYKRCKWMELGWWGSQKMKATTPVELVTTLITRLGSLAAIVAEGKPYRTGILDFAAAAVMGAVLLAPEDEEAH